MEKNKFILIDNSSYENKGCEAIVRGTVQIIDNSFGRNSEYIVETRFNSEESYIQQKLSEYDPRIKHVNASIYERKFIEKSLHRRFMDKVINKYKLYGYFEDINYKRHKHLRILEDMPDSTAGICIGGDNYSLDYGLPKLFTDTDDMILSYNKPCILWGASIGPFSKNVAFEKYMSKHLQKVTAIFAREDSTIEYLNSIGVKNNIHRVSDPAFLMEPKKPTDYDSLIGIEESIGINLSPIMAKYWADNDQEKWTAFCIDLVEKVLKLTDKIVYLVPHVVHKNNNNDYEFLKIIKNSIKNSNDRLFLLGGHYNAAEVKYLISKMTSFMGSRTHSTIAAFSTCIPSISLAYSIKAVGINKEVFGDLSYCVNKNKMWNSDHIADLLNSTIIDNAGIRNKMRNNLVKINDRSNKAGYILKDIILNTKRLH